MLLHILQILIVILLAMASFHKSSILAKNLLPEPGAIGFDGIRGIYSKAAVSCYAPKCADIGRNILEAKGTVADAAIAVLLCMGVIHSQNMGLGGGFFMVYYDKAQKKSYTMDARERAPGKASKHMYDDNSDLSLIGGLAVAVPGELKGYWELYKRFGGGVPWNDLFQPAIQLCNDGFPITSHTVTAFTSRRKEILASPSMRAVFVDPKTGDLYKEGDIIKRPELGKTLERIADDDVNGGDLLYQKDSELAQWLVEDLAAMGGIVSLKDLTEYKVTWDEPIKVKIHNDLTIHTTPPPSGGVLFAFIMRVLDKYKLQVESSDSAMAENYHLVIEAFKHAYGQRTLLGDPGDPEITNLIEEVVHNLTISDSFLKEIRQKIFPDNTSCDPSYYGAKFEQKSDHGTSHVSVVGPDGNSISITSTINYYFGAVILSNRTGIIYNDEMNDFSLPNVKNIYGLEPSPSNFIKPGKRPQSSVCPAVITDKWGDVRLSIGGIGGSRTPTAVSCVAIRNLWFNATIKSAIAAPRLHNQLLPMHTEYEEGFPQKYIQRLETLGDAMVPADPSYPSTVVGIERMPNGFLRADCDRSKICSIAGF